MITHYGCFEGESAVIDTCPPLSVLHAACLSFEVDHLFSSQSVPWNQKVTACLLFLTPLFPHSGTVITHWSESNLTTSHLSYCIPRIWL